MIMIFSFHFNIINKFNQKLHHLIIFKKDHHSFIDLKTLNQFFNYLYIILLVFKIILNIFILILNLFLYNF